MSEQQHEATVNLRRGGAGAPVIVVAGQQRRLIRPEGFVFEHSLGLGTWGEVFLAYREGVPKLNTNRLAVKFLMRSYDDLAHLMNEIDASRKLMASGRCNWVAGMHEIGLTPSGHTYFVMDYIEGKNLDEELKEKPGYHTPAQLVRLFRDLLRGVAFLSSNRLIHRDLKWGNVRLTPEGAPKIVDFGCLSIMDLRANRSPVSKERRVPQINGVVADYVVDPQGCLIGTPAFMSPEQAAGTKLDERSDVFAVGVLLSLALQGCFGNELFPLADRAEEFVADRAELKTPIPRPDLSKLKKPDALHAVLDRMLHRDPHGRPWPANAVQMLDDLLTDTTRPLDPATW